MNKNHCKQENIRLGTHGEDYGSWMSNPVFYIIGGIMEQVHRVVLSHLDYDGEAFGSHRRAAMMMLGSSRLLVGRK